MPPTTTAVRSILEGCFPTIMAGFLASGPLFHTQVQTAQATNPRQQQQNTTHEAMITTTTHTARHASSVPHSPSTQQLCWQAPTGTLTPESGSLQYACAAAAAA
ncbi:hypothetical protein DIPPA_27604 [Diplonema papillatum]|nr:hypothetical protein DIPPA_27604 [Diplonema papillatum]